jgi:hypothetical protein
VTWERVRRARGIDWAMDLFGGSGLGGDEWVDELVLGSGVSIRELRDGWKGERGQGKRKERILYFE